MQQTIAVLRKDLKDNALEPSCSDSNFLFDSNKKYNVIAQLDSDVDGFNLVLQDENGVVAMFYSIDFEFENGPVVYQFSIGHCIHVETASITTIKEVVEELAEKLKAGSEFSKHINDFIFDVEAAYQREQNLGPDDWSKIERKEPTIDWSFVEANLPGYHQRDDVAENDDLCKLVNNEFEEGSCAEQLLKERYEGNIDNPQIRIDYNVSLLKLYLDSIEAHIEKQTIIS